MKQPGNSKSLIDKYLPEYTFSEHHEVLIESPAEVVYEAAKNFDLSRSRLIKTLFKLRGLPTDRWKLQEFIADIGFTNIEENPPVENLIGFWARTKILPVTGYEDFVNNSISPRVKVVWNFYLKSFGENQTKLSTETRVLCVSPLSRFTFGLYWMMIKPFSGATRTKMLQIIKEDSESTESKEK